MTPLAQWLLKQTMAKVRDREGMWHDERNAATLRDMLNDVHCFEITEAAPLVHELIMLFKDQEESKSECLFSTHAFLPAPKTWIEWRHASGNRLGVLLQENETRTNARGTFLWKEGAQNLGLVSLVSGDYHSDGGDQIFPDYLVDLMGNQTSPGILSYAHCMLLLINSPKIIGSRQHMPHAGLARRLAGKFPLHAWTEIKLHVAKPIEIDDGEPHEAHITGRRALHFVRKHIRIRLGKLEYVSAHWRGDPAIGTRHQHYVVAP
jgi:hypothetical protein